MLCDVEPPFGAAVSESPTCKPVGFGYLQQCLVAPPSFAWVKGVVHRLALLARVVD